MADQGKLVGLICDEVCTRANRERWLTLLSQDTTTGFLLAGVGQRTAEGCNYKIVKDGKVFHIFRFHRGIPLSRVANAADTKVAEIEAAFISYTTER
jgi:hypothetical protein